MGRLRGGDLEHLKHHIDAAKRFDREMADVDPAATCRRMFEALQRAPEAQGEEQEEWAFLPDKEQTNRAKDTDLDAEWIWGETEDFIEKCGR